MKPFARWLLVKKHEAQEMTKGGLVIPKESVEKVTTGTVVAVSSSLRQEHEFQKAESERETDQEEALMSMIFGDTVEEGDVVIIPEYAGMDYRLDEGLVFIKFEDIVAVED